MKIIEKIISIISIWIFCSTSIIPLGALFMTIKDTNTLWLLQMIIIMIAILVFLWGYIYWIYKWYNKIWKWIILINMLYFLELFIFWNILYYLIENISPWSFWWYDRFITITVLLLPLSWIISSILHIYIINKYISYIDKKEFEKISDVK